MATLTERGSGVVAPLAAVAQAAANLDDTGRSELAWSLSLEAAVVVPAFGTDQALTIGALARTRLAGNIIAASVAHQALERGWTIVTSEQAAPEWQALGIPAEPLP